MKTIALDSWQRPLCSWCLPMKGWRRCNEPEDSLCWNVSKFFHWIHSHTCFHFDLSFAVVSSRKIKVSNRWLWLWYLWCESLLCFLSFILSYAICHSNGTSDLKFIYVVWSFSHSGYLKSYFVSFFLKTCCISSHRACAFSLIDPVFFLAFLCVSSLCPTQILHSGQKAHFGDSHTGLESQIGWAICRWTCRKMCW